MQNMQESLAETADDAQDQEAATMVRISEALLRRAKATAAMNGETLKQFFSAALLERVERMTGGK